jgi:hypothetical protein
MYPFPAILREEISRVLDEDPECQVVIATIAFANGQCELYWTASHSGSRTLLTCCGRRSGALEGTLKQPLGEWCSSTQAHLPPLRNKLRVGVYFLNYEAKSISSQGSSAANRTAQYAENLLALLSTLLAVFL